MSTTPPTPPALRTNEPEPAPAPAPRLPKEITCSFCDCKLSPVSGDFLSLSDKARNWRDEKENHIKEMAKLDDEIARLRAEITAKDAEIAALKGSQAQKKPGIRVRS